MEQALADGLDMVFDIDWQGYRQLRAALPGDVVGVFILPPSMAELEQRLRARAGDDPAGDRPPHGAGAQTRSATGRNSTTSSSTTNWPAPSPTSTAVLHAARLATARQPGLPGFVQALEAGRQTPIAPSNH